MNYYHVKSSIREYWLYQWGFPELDRVEFQVNRGRIASILNNGANIKSGKVGKSKDILRGFVKTLEILRIWRKIVKLKALR